MAKKIELPSPEFGDGDGRISTGIAGLDDVLGGGLPRNRLLLAEGKPGAGKTTLALQFLMEGRRHGETCLYVTLAETKHELNIIAQSHGWSLDGIHIHELIPPEASLDRDREQTLLHPSEVELVETTQLLFDEINRIQPSRVAIDSLAELRLLARNALRYRRQILALKHFFAGRECTALLLDDSSKDMDVQLHSVPHGIIELEQTPRDYGTERRRLRVVKMRGMSYRGGYHDFVILTGGIEVYPRLQLHLHARDIGEVGPVVPSGVEGLDALLGGGLAHGTNTLLIGPSGAGKTTLAITYAVRAAEQGKQAVLFSFDESSKTLLARCRGFGMPIDDYVERKLIRLHPIDPAELSPGEFAHQMARAVEHDRAAVIIIDTLNGYLNSMPGEHFLILQMHELLSYLNHQGILTLLVMAQHGILGDMKTPTDLSYLSDTVLLLRYFESGGEVRQAISVVKKRIGPHERSIREYRLSSKGVEVGPPLMDFHGVLTGVPEYIGKSRRLLPSASDEQDV
jgi:circadian clock protein KaiC